MSDYKSKKNRFSSSTVLSALFIVLLPSFIQVSFNTSSLAIGLLIASFLVLLINYELLVNLRIRPIILNIYFMVIFVLLLSGVYFYLKEAITKPLYSIGIILVIFSSFILSKKIKKLDYSVLSNSILIIILLLLFLGWIKLFFTITCCHYNLLEKPVFPFSEESHYALAIGILSAAYISTGKLFWIVFIEINMLLLSFLFPNLTLLVFVFLNMMIALFRMNSKYFTLFMLLIPVFGILAIVGVISVSDYFSSRLNFEDTRNVTTLVFLQSWDMAYLNLMETDGLGLGFQMLGMIETSLSEYTTRIMVIAEKNLNLLDGGLLASKIISEFGIIGCMLIVYYLFFVVRFAFYSNKTWMIINSINNTQLIDELRKKLLVLSLVFGFSVEVFLRGYGYFSPGLFFVFVAIFYNIEPLENSNKRLIIKNVIHKKS